MACFMTENPDSGANQALDKAVKCPGSKSQSSIFNARNVTKRSTSKGSNQDHVTNQVAQRLNRRRFKAVFRNSTTQSVDVRIHRSTRRADEFLMG